MKSGCVPGAAGRPSGAAPTRRAVIAGGLGTGAMLAWPGRGIADDAPTRGGTLEFAVLVEPKNYDCVSNTS
ncbi:MAG TPA: hypothetical protein VME41_09720, partial [Stellaceae bacterium]|nr:hypothetical protein [Stellaceae bacterium]